MSSPTTVSSIKKQVFVKKVTDDAGKVSYVKLDKLPPGFKIQGVVQAKSTFSLPKLPVTSDVTAHPEETVPEEVIDLSDEDITTKTPPPPCKGGSAAGTKKGKQAAKQDSPQAAGTVKKATPVRNKWSDGEIHAMIDYFDDNKETFTSGNCANTWEKFAEELSKNRKAGPVTAVNCRNKWGDLKSTYKEAKDSLNTSGMGVGNPEEKDLSKKYVMKWKFFDLMDEVLHDAPEVNPKSTCSTSRPVKRKDGEEGKEGKEDKATLKKKSRQQELETYRNNRLEMSERHHQEKMDAFKEHRDDTAKLLKLLSASTENKQD